MPFGIGTGLLAGGAIGGIGSLASAVIGSGAATSAAKTQAQAEQYATLLQSNIYNQTLSNYYPFLQAGYQNLGALYGPNGLLSPQAGLSGPLASQVAGAAGQGVPFPNLPQAPSGPQFAPTFTGGAGPPPATMSGASLAYSPFSFSPTLDQLARFPGYQFALQQGEEDVASQYGGSQPGGAEQKAQTRFAEGLAAQTEGQAFSQAAQTSGLQFGQGLGAAQFGFGTGLQASQFNLQDWLNQYQQQLASYTSQGQLGLGYGQLALGTGQANFSDVLQSILQRYQMGTGGATTLASLFGGGVSTGLTAAGGGAGTASTLGPAIAGSIGAIGAAGAAGTIGSANALTSGISGVGSSAGNTALLLALSDAGLFGPSGGAVATSPYSPLNPMGLGAGSYTGIYG